MIQYRKKGKRNQLLRIDWDIIAGIAAAGTAIVLHLLHIVHESVLLTIAVVLMALLLFRDLRRENRDEDVSETLDQLMTNVRDIQLSVELPAAILVGPRHLRSESRRFVETSRGEMIWFNVCFLMFQSQEIFDLLLKPAIENPLVRSIQFVSDAGEQELWTRNMLPKIKECDGYEKVSEPRWRKLPQTVSFILADTEPSGKTEALLSFWGEPFMAKTTEKQVPRYIFRIQGDSELITQLVELERHHRLDKA